MVQQALGLMPKGKKRSKVAWVQRHVSFISDMLYVIKWMEEKLVYNKRQEIFKHNTTHSQIT